MARKRRSRSKRSRWTRPKGYTDSLGRARTAHGFLKNKKVGMHGSVFRQDYEWHDEWFKRNVPWWRTFGLIGGKVYDCDGRNGLRLMSDIYPNDRRYTTFDGKPVPEYDGPYLCYNAVRYLGRRGITVPPWAQMRSAGRTHNVDVIQFPGCGGSPYKGYGGHLENGVYTPHKRAR